MQNTQFFLWLRTLRPEDMLPFRQYLAQPQNAVWKLAIAFFDYLQVHQATWRDVEVITAPQLKEAAIFTHLYPGETLKPQRLRRIMMELRTLIQAYATHGTRSFLRPSLDAEFRTLLYLLERNSPLFLERYHAVTTMIESAELADDLPLARMWIVQLYNEYLIHRQAPEDMFEQQLDHLDEFYLLVKLETWTSMRTREYRHPQRYAYPFAEEIDRMAAAVGTDKPMVALWRAVFAMVGSEASSELFQETLDALELVKPRLGIRILRQVRGYLFNTLMRTRQTDNLPFFQRLHALLDNMLQEGTLHLPDGRMSHPFFLSYVRAACLSGNGEKADAFIQANQAMLVSADSEGLLRYSNALVAYSLAQPKKSWKILSVLKFNDLRTDAYARMLQVQSAYTLGQEDDVFRCNDALRKFLERHPELGERFVSLVKRFSQFVDSLAKVKFGHNQPISTLVKRIQKEDAAEKLWLLTEANTLGLK